MANGIGRGRGFAAAAMMAVAAGVALAGLLAACAPQHPGPAPVIYGVMPAGGAGIAVRTPPAGRAHRQVVRRSRPAAAAPVSLAALPPARPKAKPAAPKAPAIIALDEGAAAVAPKPAKRPAAPPPPAHGASARAPAAHKPIALQPAPVATSPPAGAHVEARREAPREMRLAEREAPPRPPPKPAMRPPAAAHQAAARPQKPIGRKAAHRGDGFLWPVRGRILEGFGPGPNGIHNDGINIAAPRGTPVEAVQSGVVAYAGNELRGYGNLILIKHPRGWISAYAHCDLILVKRGQKVSRGQVIARVGSTGNVGKPQLHFELRRGKEPINPREFLGPQPTAAVDAGPRRG